jgi:arylsulfatase A-like enzyme
MASKTRALTGWALVLGGPVLGAGLGGALAGCSHDAPRPRGVLLISVDSLRADHLSCYGYRSATRPGEPTSPIVDRELAQGGLRFARAVSTTSWTLPAHMSLFTGEPQELHGVKSIENRLHESHALLAELLRAERWRTAGFWSGPNLHPEFGFGRGFEQYVDCSSAPVQDPAVFHTNGDPQATANLQTAERASHQGITGPKVVEEFSRWFSGVGEGERFFAFVHFWDVHFDYAAPKEFDVFDPDYGGAVNGSNFWELAKDPQRSPRDVQHLLALYDAELRFTDKNLGAILDALRARGRLDDTLVVFVSDHGEEFFEHGLFGHNHSLYEEVVRIPLLMRYPPIFAAGSRSDALVSLADVAPTILDLCGIAQPATMWGRSLAPLVHGTLRERAAPMELSFKKPENFLRGYRSRDFKVLQHSKESQPTLYDLAVDPGETRPIHSAPGAPGGADDPRFVAAGSWWSSLDRLAQERALGVPVQRSPELDQWLRGTGYLGEEEHK